MPSNVKRTMKCGEVRKSTRRGKKIMKLYCLKTPGGKEKRKLVSWLHYVDFPSSFLHLQVHAGAEGYGHNYSSKARASFRARHKCSTAQPGTARHLACTELWSGPQGRKKNPPSKRKSK